MDALKGCTSNVHVLKDLDATRFRLYVCEEPASSCAQHVLNTIIQLRSENVVCVATGERIWVFGGAEEGEGLDHMVDGFSLETQSTIAEHNQTISAEGIPIISTLLDALEGSISFVLSRAQSALKISPWVWVLPATELQDSSIEIHMQTQLADDEKKLNIATTLRSSNLVSVRSKTPSSISEIIVAPSGMLATMFMQENSGSVTFPSALGNDRWKASIRELLAAEGLEVSADTPWLSIVPAGLQKAVCWPSSLCFARAIQSTVGTPSGSLTDWRSWFDLCEAGNYDDPLSFAEEWTTTFAEREAQQHSHVTIRPEISTMDDLSGTQALHDGTVLDVSSPPLTNRPDLQALQRIYPTPPDGLLAHAATQVQPQSEHTLMPNVDSGHAPNFTTSDPAPDTTMATFDGDLNAEVEQPQRNLSIVSATDPHTQAWNRGSSDDLFGDMDDMEYGREEVGDADFNFFDDPDADPATNTAGISYEPERANVLEHAPMLNDPHHAATMHKSKQGSDLHVSTDSPNIEMETEDIASPNVSNGSSPKSFHDNEFDTREDHLGKVEQFSPILHSVKAQQLDNTKPLSPFGIKEALLPPPIPASASHNFAKMAGERRRSSFGPLVFNASNTFAPQSSSKDYSDYRSDERHLSHELGPTKVPRKAVSESSVSMDTPSSLEDAESEDHTGSDAESDALPTISELQRLTEVKLEGNANLATRKRKRTLDAFPYCGPQSIMAQQGARDQHAASGDISDALPADMTQDLISRLLGKVGSSGILDSLDPQESKPARATSRPEEEQGTDQAGQNQSEDANQSISLGPQYARKISDPTLQSVKHIFTNLKPNDFVVLGQIVAEQAVAVARNLASEFATSGHHVNDAQDGPCPALQNLDADLEAVSCDLAVCDISSLALVREPLQVQRSQTTQASANSASQARHPPRPPPRVDPTTLGPDIIPLAASFIRANRGEGVWEMAPTAIGFWEALGLSPVSGPKDIRLFCMAPDNAALEDPVNELLLNLKAAYEGCKFGSMAIDLETGSTSPHQDANNVHLVSIEGSATPSVATAMQAYWDACSALGSELADIAFDEPARTLVVSMVNPFPSALGDEWATASQYFAACFLNLSKAYHNAASRDKRFSGKGLSQRQVSDIDFKVIPIDLVASPLGLVIPTAQQMALLAREMYDRCPPASNVAVESSPLSIAAAPSVELVSPLPKRIGFQLSSEPPTDLLHEASVLHVAYAISPDCKWANIIWHDNTGRYANSSALCMQGRSFADIALEVWRRTMDIIKAREVIWRIFIVTAGNDGIEASRANCWKDIISQHTERKQLLSVTLLHFQPDLALNITPPPESQPPGSAAPTPAATPQPASGQGFSTTSPDAVSAGNAPGTAPPTPAPSEAASTILEADLEAHLVKVEDETWGMLIDRNVAATLRTPRIWSEPAGKKSDQIAALSYGVLIKRGKSGNAASSFASERPFPCAGASLIWTLRVRSKGDRQGAGERPNVDEGSARHCEVMLREVLGMFRNLGLLSKIKGLDASGLIPVHIIAAMKGAEGLNGLLGE